MTLTVSLRYSTTPNGLPNSCTSVRIESASVRAADVKEIVQGRYPRWYNIQITGIKQG